MSFPFAFSRSVELQRQHLAVFLWVPLLLLLVIKLDEVGFVTLPRLLLLDLVPEVDEVPFLIAVALRSLGKILVVELLARSLRLKNAPGSLAALFQVHPIPLASLLLPLAVILVTHDPDNSVTGSDVGSRPVLGPNFLEATILLSPQVDLREQSVPDVLWPLIPLSSAEVEFVAKIEFGASRGLVDGVIGFWRSALLLQVLLESNPVLLRERLPSISPVGDGGQLADQLLREECGPFLVQVKSVLEQRLVVEGSVLLLGKVFANEI